MCVIQDFSAHAREHALGYKMHFPRPARGLENFQNNLHDSNLGRSSHDCMVISMLKPTAQRQKLALIFSTRKMLFRRSTSLDRRHCRSQPYALFCVGNLALLNKALHCSYGKFDFQCVSDGLHSLARNS